mgnify:FL=1
MASTAVKYEKKMKQEKIRDCYQVMQNFQEPPSWSGRPWVGADRKS